MLNSSGVTMLVGAGKGLRGGRGLWHPDAVSRMHGPADLTWQDVDPARHPFDPPQAREFVRWCGPARMVPEPPPRRPPSAGADYAARNAWMGLSRAWSDAMTRVLVEHYGPWAAGWRWARGEGDVDGGPVGAWCCPHDSITTAAATRDPRAGRLGDRRAAGHRQRG